ncbi:MAG: polysaccharide biosynthesis protein [Candidatus Omnitrophota bacterium]|nr:MAG: polysaccharide biosynthesis protein [Candidatus Omnitrophota bacterium]
MSSKAKTLTRGSGLRIGHFFVHSLVALMLMPFIIRSLGNRMYGLWIVVGTFTGYYWLFDLGLGSAIQRYVSRAIGRKDYHEANVVINTTLFLFSILGLCILLTSVIVAAVGPLLIRDIAQDTLTFQKIILILGIGFAIDFPMRVFSGILTSHIRYDLKTSIGLFTLAARTILIVVFLKNGYGIFALALITIAVNMLRYVMTFFVAKGVAGYLVISKKFIDRKQIKSLFRYSGFTFINQIATRLRFHIDNFVIAAFLGLSFVTIYSIAARLIRYFMEFILSAIGIMVPVFSQYEAKGDYASIRNKFLFMTKISGYLSILIGGILIIFGRAFIQRWMGQDYISAYPVLVVLVVGIIFSCIQTPSAQLLYGISKHKFYAILNSIEGVANIILSVILVKRFGLMGVALGTTIPMIINKVFIQPVYTCRVVHLGVYTYYCKVLIPTLLKSAGIFAGLWYFCKSFIVANYMQLTILVACISVVFAGFVFLAGLTRIERSYFKRIIYS